VDNTILGLHREEIRGQNRLPSIVTAVGGYNKETRNTYRILVSQPLGKQPLDQEGDGKIILRRILREWDVGGTESVPAGYYISGSKSPGSYTI
jgi:hypothetical protein